MSALAAPILVVFGRSSSDPSESAFVDDLDDSHEEMSDGIVDLCDWPEVGRRPLPSEPFADMPEAGKGDDGGASSEADRSGVSVGAVSPDIGGVCCS